MANKFSKHIILFIFFTFAFIIENLYAQEIKNDFSQKLEWESDAEAYEYKIEIKNLATEKISVFTTDKTQIEISFPSGNYEWRVIAYDFLGRESTETQWENFTIKKAIEPAVKITNTEIVAYIQDRFFIPIESTKVEPDAIVELIDPKTKETIPGTIQEDSVVFETVPEGNYKIKITNPGGLYSETEMIKLSDKKQIDEENQIKEEKLAAKEAEKQQLEEERFAKAAEKAEEKQLAKEKKLEEAKLAEEERKTKREQQNEEKQRRKEQKAQEKEAARLAQENKKKNDIFIMIGAYYPVPIFNNQLFINNRNVTGTSFKFEMFPMQSGNLKLGFNMEITPTIVALTNPYSSNPLVFLPYTINLALSIPIVEQKISLVIQAGCGRVEVFDYGKYFGHSTSDIVNKYLGLTNDVGLSFRFIIGNNAAFDISGEFTNWYLGFENIPSIMIGMQLGIWL